MRLRTFAKTLRIMFLYPLLLIIALIIGSYGYLMFGPFSFPTLAHLMEKYAKHNYPGIDIEIKDMQMGVDKKSKLIFVWLNDVKLTIGAQWQPITLKKLEMKVHPLAIIPGEAFNFINFEFSMDSLPSWASSDTPDKGKEIDFVEAHKWLQINQKLLDQLCYILANSIVDIKLPNNNTVLFDILRAKIIPHKEGEKVTYQADIEATINDYRFESSSLFDVLDNGDLNINTSIKNLDSKLLSEVGLMEAISKDIDLKVDANFIARIAPNYVVQNISFDIQGKDGLIKKSNLFPSKLPITKLTLKGDVLQNFKAIKVSNINLVSLDKNINGMLKYEKEVLYANLFLDPLSLENILNAWPKTVAASVREWIEKYIITAKTGRINVIFNVDTHDIARGVPMLRDGALAKIPIYNTTMVFPENAPAIEGIEGVLTVYGDAIDMNITHAKMQNSKLSNVEVHIKDIPFARTDLNLKGTISGPIQEAIDMAFVQADKPNDSLKNFSGEAHTNLNLTMPISEDSSLNDLKIVADSKLQNVAVTKLLGKYTISKGNFDLKVYDGMLYLKGTALYANFIPITIDRQQHLFSEKQPQFISQTTIDANITRKQIAQLGYQVPEEVEGNAFKISIKADEATEDNIQSRLVIDMRKNAVKVHSLGLLKHVGEPGELSVKLDTNEKKQLAGTYQLKIPNLKSDGNVSFNDANDIIAINSDNTNVNGHSFGFIYKRGVANYFLLKGELLDLSKIDLSNLLTSNNNPRDRPLILESKVKKVMLKNGVLLYNPLINAKCDITQCKNFSFQGNFANGGNMNIMVSYPKVTLASNNAGAFISAIDVSKNIVQGDLKLEAYYTSPQHLKGDLVVNKFYMQKAPLFAKLISLVSVTTGSGLISLMQNKGIFFQDMHCTFKMHDSILDVTRCLQKGPVMEIDINGKLDLARKQMNIQGVLTPANIVNSAADSIPIIGDLLTGGKDSHFISSNFTVKGSFDSPSVWANPLSIVTPGLLKKIFGRTKPIESVD